jgi:hypothetical protein
MSIIKLVTLPLLKKQVSKKFKLKGSEIEHIFFQVVKSIYKDQPSHILIRVNGIYESDTTIEEIGPMNFQNVEKSIMKNISSEATLDAFTIGILWPSKQIELNMFYQTKEGEKKHLKIENLDL